MIRSAAGKVMWVGRATVFLVGLAVILALVFGVAATAMGANGKPFILGKASNAATKVTGLVGRVAAGEALVVKNPSGGSALGLSVGDPLADPASKTVAPMKVDSQAKVGNLNADQLDGKDSTDFLGKTEKAADADMLDGRNPSDFVDTLAQTHLPIKGTNTDQSITFDYEPLRSVGNFTKTSASSTVKLTWSGHISRGGTTGFCDFQLRIDNAQPPSLAASAVLYGAEAPIPSIAYFPNLGQGPHTVSIWVRGNATNCIQNLGNFNEEVWVEEIR